MKNKVIFIGIIVFILCIINSMSVYAISLNLDITGEKTVEVDNTIQLKAEYWVGNDIWLPDEPGGGIGEVSREDVTNESSWTSSNNNIAVVDNKGNVTGVSEGTVTITAQYLDSTRGADRDATYEITVTPKSNTEYTGIRFFYDEPGPGMNLNSEDKFSIGLYNIPKTEKENIRFRIENESIAKITKTEYDKSWADAIATIKYLSVGKTKLIATLNYNGKTYSDSYDLEVIDSNESLVLSAKEYTNLPLSLKIGDKLQLTATIKYKRGSLVPRDVTSEGTIWESSNEKVVKIDKNGMITAIGEGTATITASYEVYEGRTIKTTYDIDVLNPNKDDGKKEEDPTTAKKIIPHTGQNVMIIVAIGILTVFSMILLGKYRKTNKVGH